MRVLSIALLSLINDWQSGNGNFSAESLSELEREALTLDEEFRRCEQSPHFHKTSLTVDPSADFFGRTWVKLLGRDGCCLPAAGWTTRRAVAERHKVMDASRDDARFGLIVERIPGQNEIIINLDRLYASGAIDDAVASYAEDEFSDGIRSIGNSEHEVILRPCTFTPNDIWAMRNPAQEFQDFLAVFDTAFNEPEENGTEIETLWDRIEQAGLRGQHAAWLEGNHARVVLVHVLAAIRQRHPEFAGRLIDPADIRLDRPGGSLTVIPVK